MSDVLIKKLDALEYAVHLRTLTEKSFPDGYGRLSDADHQAFCQANDRVKVCRDDLIAAILPDREAFDAAVLTLMLHAITFALSPSPNSQDEMTGYQSALRNLVYSEGDDHA